MWVVGKDDSGVSSKRGYYWELIIPISTNLMCLKEFLSFLSNVLTF